MGAIRTTRFLSLRSSCAGVLVAASAACSSGSTAAPGSPPPAVVNPLNDSGVGSGKEGGVTSGLLNGCTQADFDATDARAPAGDAGASVRAITFPKGLPVAQYTPRCMKIKVGETVSWTGGFDIHPMEAFPADPNNPITVTDFGFGSVSFAFAKAGTYGFHCQDHSLDMFGAILVVEN